MPSSSQMVSRNSGAVILGLRISAISAFFGVCASSERTMVVLPVPTSPVSCTKPPASLMPYSRCASASACRSLRYR